MVNSLRDRWTFASEAHGEIDENLVMNAIDGWHHRNEIADTPTLDQVANGRWRVPAGTALLPDPLVPRADTLFIGIGKDIYEMSLDYEVDYEEGHGHEQCYCLVRSALVDGVHRDHLGKPI